MNLCRIFIFHLNPKLNSWLIENLKYNILLYKMVIIMNTIIILAGGKGTRFNAPIEKQYNEVSNGKSILEMTLERIKSYKLFDEYVIVTRLNWLQWTNDLVKRLKIKRFNIVVSGNTRNESMINGMQVANGEKIVVHDAVRPLTPKEVFEEVLEKLDKYDVVTTVRNITGNLARIGNNQIIDVLDRNKYVIGEAPTGYNKDVVEKILEEYDRNHSIVELPHDIQIPLKLGYNVGYIVYNGFNLKITYKSDLETLRKLIE